MNQDEIVAYCLAKCPPRNYFRRFGRVVLFSRRDRDVVGQVDVDDASLQVGASEAAKSMSLDLDAPVSLGMIAGLARKRPDLAELHTQLAIMALAWSWPAGRGPASALAQHERSKSPKQTLFARES